MRSWRFSQARGTPLGGQFQINTYTTSYQLYPSVAMGADGSFVVVWDSLGSPASDASALSVQARRFSAAGEPEGAQWQVNSYTTDNQQLADVAIEADGDVVVVWQSVGSYGTDDDGWSVQASLNPLPVFADGFESGDVSQWSSSVGQSP